MRNKLRNKRLQKQYSVEQLASKLDISPSYLYKIESGIRNPNIELAQKISTLLDEEISELFFNKELDEKSYNKS